MFFTCCSEPHLVRYATEKAAALLMVTWVMWLWGVSVDAKRDAEGPHDLAYVWVVHKDVSCSLRV